MDTFKVIYKNNGRYFKQDYVENVKLQNIEFSKKNIDYCVNLGIKTFKCNIEAPLEKLFKINKELTTCITVQFLDYCCYFKENSFKLSDEYFSKKEIRFTNDIEVISKDVINLQNNDITNLVDIDNTNLEIIPISDDEIIELYIQKINEIELNDRILEEISILFCILNRMTYGNISSSKLYNKLHSVIIKKIYHIYNYFDFNCIKVGDSISLMNEVMEISRLSNDEDSNSTHQNYLDKEYNLLEKLYDVIKLDFKIKSLKFDTSYYDNERFKKSKNFYYSAITRTNWIDELEYNNITGLLVKIDPKEINKNAYNLDYVPIMDITHTIISLEQILEAYKIYHESNNTLFDDYLGNNIISGFGIGNGNCMIPLYLDKNHWNLVEHYLDLNNGIIFNRNPLVSKKRHNDIYYNIMTNMINYTFSDDNYSSEKWIQLLFSMLRTVYQISKFDSYLISKFKNNPVYRVDCNINKMLILSLFDNNDDMVRYIIEEQIRRKMKSLYRDITVLDTIYDFSDIEECLSYEFDYFNGNLNFKIKESKFKTYIEDLEENNIFSSLITMIHGIVSMRTIIKNDFINIFEHLDKNGGVLNDELLHELKKKITDNLIKPTNYLLKSSINPKFSSHLNFTKNKKFRINTLKDNNLLNTDEQMKSLIIQSIIQRVNKCRKRAIDNDKYLDPYVNEKNIINNTGILISSRYIRNYFNLTKNFKSYIDTINNLGSNLKFIVLLLIHIRKTVSLKKNILSNLNLINSKENQEIITNIFNKKLLPEQFKQYEILLKV